MATYGLVTGHFTTQLVDNSDPDTLPQTVPLKGKIPFKLNVKKLIDNSDPLNPTVIGSSVIEGILDDQGWLSTPGPDGKPMYRGLWLPATDDPNCLPRTGVAYDVSYKLTDPNNVSVEILAHKLAVPGNATVNLANFIEPDGAPVQSVAAAQASAALAIQAAASAVRTINSQPPDVNGNVNVTGGTGGPPPDLSGYYTKDQADQKYQLKGSFALAADLVSVSSHVDTVEALASGAKSDAATAKSTATSASTAAGTASTKADQALTKANAALTAETYATAVKGQRFELTPDAGGAFPVVRPGLTSRTDIFFDLRAPIAQMPASGASLGLVKGDSFVEEG